MTYQTTEQAFAEALTKWVRERVEDQTYYVLSGAPNLLDDSTAQLVEYRERIARIDELRNTETQIKFLINEFFGIKYTD